MFEKSNLILREVLLYLVFFCICTFSCFASSQDGKKQKKFPGLKTNTAKRLIDLSELQSGGVGKDGIPSIDSPKFMRIENAKEWLKSNEPVIAVSIGINAKAYPFGQVLSKKTGYTRRYGKNPYKGYDDINKNPFMYKGKTDPRLSPLEKVVGVKIGKDGKAYPYSITRKMRVINDVVGGKAIVVLHVSGATSALDATIISQSKQAGSTGVFGRKIGDRVLNFIFEGGKFRDRETKSVWSITGAAIEGPLKGKSLEKIVHGDYFAFAWLVFRPETEIYKYSAEPLKQ